MPIVFDWTINLGHIFTFTAAIMAVAGAYWGTRYEIKLLSAQMKSSGELMAERMGNLGGRVINIETETRELRIVATSLAETTQKLANMDGRINEQAGRITRIEDRISASRARRTD